MNIKELTSKFNFLSWEHRKKSQPKTIEFINEYSNQSDLRLACTQLSISTSEQKKLIKDWSLFLSNNNNITSLFFYSKVSQDLLNSATKMDKLDSLFIKWSGKEITDYEVLKNLPNLKRLYIGAGTTLKNLTSLKYLNQLEWLEIHEQKNMISLSGIETLSSLKGLIISGGIYGKQKIDDLIPLSNLHKLEYLGISSTFALSKNLSPICSLQNLTYLDLPIYYEMNEYAKIVNCLPNCNHGIKAYRETDIKCDKCKTGNKVYPMNKGSRQICTHCDKDKLEALNSKFEIMVKQLKASTIL